MEIVPVGANIGRSKTVTNENALMIIFYNEWVEPMLISLSSMSVALTPGFERSSI